MIVATKPVKSASSSGRSQLAVLASVKLTVTLLTLIAATVLIGAWCPQESAVGFQKVIDMFGEKNALQLSRYGITDIFHSAWFLILIGMLTVNMIACSMQRVFPKVRLLKQPFSFFTGKEIAKLPFNMELTLPGTPDLALANLERSLRRHGYTVRRQADSLAGDWGKFARLAATVTHIGLLTLLAGVTITSWTGFSGFKPIPLHATMSFASSEHSKLWIGKLPDWKVYVDGTRREDYPTGEPKQWYSNLVVIDAGGREVKRQEISVNNPLSYAGVDIYQSSWGLDKVVVSFNGHLRALDLRQMGKVNAAFLPLDEQTILIFSIHDQAKPLKVFAKTPQWDAPKLLTEIPQGKAVKLGSVELGYKELLPITGLQYKSDPGYGVTLVAFAFITAGVLLAAVPYRQVWAHAEAAQAAETKAVEAKFDDSVALPAGQTGGNFCILSVGGRSAKAKRAFEKSLSNILADTQLHKLTDEVGAYCIGASNAPLHSGREIMQADTRLDVNESAQETITNV